MVDTKVEYLGNGVVRLITVSSTEVSVESLKKQRDYLLTIKDMKSIEKATELEDIDRRLAGLDDILKQCSE
jgi:hypothetical protein